MMNMREYLNPGFTHMFFIMYEERDSYYDVLEHILKFENKFEILDDFYYNLKDLDEMKMKYTIDVDDTILLRIFMKYFDFMIVVNGIYTFEKLDYKKIFPFVNEDDNKFINNMCEEYANKISEEYADIGSIIDEYYYGKIPRYLTHSFMRKYDAHNHFYTHFYVNLHEDRDIDIALKILDCGVVCLTDGGKL